MKGRLLKTEGFGAGSYGAFAPADTHCFIKASGVLSRQLHHQIARVCVLGVRVFAGSGGWTGFLEVFFLFVSLYLSSQTPFLVYFA